jgi:hypothetical protein
MKQQQNQSEMRNWLDGVCVDPAEAFGATYRDACEDVPENEWLFDQSHDEPEEGRCDDGNCYLR